MTSRTEVHPDAVFESLLAKGGRSTRLRNLNSVHDICRRHYECGSRDFSIPTIGKLCETQGVLKARGLYNAPLADYKTLIETWAAYSGPFVTPPKKTKVLASEEFLMRIDDPAIRSIMQSIIVERNMLKAQLNTLKANTTLVIDRRPLGGQVSMSAGAQPITVFAMKAQLTDSEKNAIRKSISADFFMHHGWQELSVGEVVNAKGRTIFDPGYTTAIRKILME